LTACVFRLATHLKTQLLVCASQLFGEGCFSCRHTTFACSRALSRVNNSSQTMHLRMPCSILNTFPLWSAELTLAQIPALILLSSSVYAIACTSPGTISYDFGQSTLFPLVVYRAA
jgi:hypothetical protein